jgi:hypothetical protein
MGSHTKTFHYLTVGILKTAGIGAQKVCQKLPLDTNLEQIRKVAVNLPAMFHNPRQYMKE